MTCDSTKILITGGAGFIGSQLGYYLSQKGYNVYLLDNMNHGHEDNLNIQGKTFGKFINADIRDYDFSKYTEGMDCVVHLAGLSSLPLCQSKPMYAMDVNVSGTANVLEACRKNSVPRVIFASTGALYEGSVDVPFIEDRDVEPFLVYPTSKHMAEQLCETYEVCYGMDIVRLRFFNVYGPHQDFKRKQPPFTGYLLKQFLAGEGVSVFSDGEQRRDYVHVNDLTRLIEICLTHPNARNRIFNACSGQAYSVNEIAQKMMSLFGIDVPVLYKDSKTYWDNYPELYEPENFSMNRNIVEDEVDKYCLGNTSKAKECLGWEAKVSLEEGLQTLVDYARELS
jgi:UDP-glucose 4-epimerase